MASPIKILGTLRGVSLKSKVGDDNRTTHMIGLSLEITEGVDRIQEVVERVKQIVQIEVDPRQPRLTDKP